MTDLQNANSLTIPSNRFRTSRDSASIPYNWQRSDALLQDKILHPDTVRECMARLAEKGGDLAYTPEMQARISTELQQRYESDIGNDIFVLPNYAPYEDPELAAFYGIDTTMTSNIQTRKETFSEQKNRIVEEVCRQLEVELPGLAQMMDHYRREGWARYGVADEAPFMHSDPDITLFRNPQRGWSSMDVAVATSNKGNVIDMYEGQPEYTFPTPHPGWEIDVPGGYWDSLS
jgi:hypothetical protein